MNEIYSYTEQSEFDTYFKMECLKWIAKEYERDGIPDRPARRETYNNTIDIMVKNEELPEYAMDWCISDTLETTLYWL